MAPGLRAGLRVKGAGPERGLIVRWVAANLVGWALGIAVFQLSRALLPYQLASASFPLQGAAVGFCQWFALRRIVPVVGWVLACAIGFPVGLTVTQSLAYGGLGLTLMAGPLAWSLLSILQWRVLRKIVARSGWWVIVNSIGLAVATVVGFIVSRSLGSAVIASATQGSRTAGGSVMIEGGTRAGYLFALAQTAGTAIGVAISAVLTGVLLAWCLRRSRPEALAAGG